VLHIQAIGLLEIGGQQIGRFGQATPSIHPTEPAGGRVLWSIRVWLLLFLPEPPHKFTLILSPAKRLLAHQSGEQRGAPMCMYTIMATSKTRKRQDRTTIHCAQMTIRPICHREND